MKSGKGAEGGYLQSRDTARLIAEDKHPNKLLIASELRYRRLFESARDGILILDAETGMVVDVNPFLIELLGYTHEMFLDKKIWELGFLKDILANEANFKELQAKEYIRYDNLALETSDGRRVEVEFVSNVYLVNNHSVIQCNIRDMTERKLAAEAFRTSQKFIEDIINAIPVRIFWKDKNLVYLGCNTVFANDAGFANSKDIIGKDDYQMVWRDQADSYRADDRQVIESGSSKSLKEELQTTPQGNLMTLLTNKMPLRNVKGEISGMLGTYMDITERKLAEESHARLAMAVEQSGETIVITDTQGVILYANPAFEKSSGYKRADVLGQNARLLKSGKQDPEFYRRMWEVLGRGEVWGGHFINRRKDGTFYEEEVTISPVRDETKKIVNYVAVKRDVTREVQLETQLRQSQKMEGIGQLAAGVAHDFNNILAAIQLNADMLKTGENLTPQHLDSAGDILQATERAANLTRQLLLFSRRQTMQMRSLDLTQTVNDLTKMLRRILRESIHIQFKFAMQPLIIDADAGMMDQVLMNLAVNARDAMPIGGQLVIETSAVEFDELVLAHSLHSHSGSFVCLSVSDSGCGIPPEDLPHIFEPFFTTKDVGKGTGLGLATVFGIVQQHQGWINVYSEVGHGTTFRIYFPRLTGKSVPESKLPALTSVRGGDETILLAEDEGALRSSIRGALSHLGYLVLESANGIEALEAWKQHGNKIDLLLTDMVMPSGMTGLELAARLSKESPKLKVIYMSGYIAEVAGVDLQLKEGVNFLTKPFGTQKLGQIVRETLDFGGKHNT